MTTDLRSYMLLHQRRAHGISLPRLLVHSDPYYVGNPVGRELRPGGSGIGSALSDRLRLVNRANGVCCVLRYGLP